MGLSKPCSTCVFLKKITYIQEGCINDTELNFCTNVITNTLLADLNKNQLFEYITNCDFYEPTTKQPITKGE